MVFSAGLEEEEEAEEAEKKEEIEEDIRMVLFV